MEFLQTQGGKGTARGVFILFNYFQRRLCFTEQANGLFNVTPFEGILRLGNNLIGFAQNVGHVFSHTCLLLFFALAKETCLNHRCTPNQQG